MSLGIVSAALQLSTAAELCVEESGKPHAGSKGDIAI